MFILIGCFRNIFTAKNRAHIFTRFSAFRSGFGNLPPLDKLLLGYVTLICALTFVLTLAPPSGADYDSLTYHLAAPQRYLDANHISELPYDHHTYFPFTVEMWFLLGLSLKGPVLAKLFHWMCLPLSCAALWAFGRRNLGVRAASWAAALWASLPVVQGEATTAYIDLGFALWVILAFGCVANWEETRDRKWLLWSGAFVGFALGTKYLGALTFGFLGLWILGRMVSSRQLQPVALIRFASLAVLLGGGWYLRNFLWTGNPVYPFAYGLFGGKGWTAQMAQDYTRDQLAYGFGRGPLDLLLAPWRLSMSPLNSIATTQQGLVLLPQPYWPMSADALPAGHTGLFESVGLSLQVLIGPPLLAFGLPAVFVRRKPPVLGLCLWAVAFFGAFWFVTGQYLRYLLPAFALLCLPCGWMIARVLERSAVLKWTALASLLAWFTFGAALTWHNASSQLPVVFGQETPEHYLRRTFAPYEAMEWLNAHKSSPETPNAPVKMVAVYGEPRCFYLRASYYWADDPHNQLIDYFRVHDGPTLIAELRRLNTTHVLWNTTGPFGPPREALQNAVNRGLLHSEFESHGCTVYALTGGGQP